MSKEAAENSSSQLASSLKALQEALPDPGVSLAQANKDGYVTVRQFLYNTGIGIHPSNISRSWRTHCDNGEMERIRVHDGHGRPWAYRRTDYVFD